MSNSRKLVSRLNTTLIVILSLAAIHIPIRLLGQPCDIPGTETGRLSINARQLDEIVVKRTCMRSPLWPDVHGTALGTDSIDKAIMGLLQRQETEYTRIRKTDSLAVGEMIYSRKVCSVIDSSWSGEDFFATSLQSIGIKEAVLTRFSFSIDSLALDSHSSMTICCFDDGSSLKTDVRTQGIQDTARLFFASSIHYLVFERALIGKLGTTSDTIVLAPYIWEFLLSRYVLHPRVKDNLIVEFDVTTSGMIILNCEVHFCSDGALYDETGFLRGAIIINPLNMTVQEMRLTAEISGEPKTDRLPMEAITRLMIDFAVGGMQ